MSVSRAQRRKVDEIKYRGTGIISDKKAEAYGPELRRITADNGGVAPLEAVVAAARPRGSVLHEWVFHYSDADAVEQHRLERAAYLINHVVEVKIDAASSEEVQEPVIVSVRDETGAVGYHDRRALDPDAWHDRKLMSGLADLRSFVHRFADLPELQPVVAVIRKIFKLRDEAL